MRYKKMASQLQAPFNPSTTLPFGLVGEIALRCVNCEQRKNVYFVIFRGLNAQVISLDTMLSSQR